jgi:cutinase
VNTVTPPVIRMGRSAAQAARSTVFAALAVAAISAGSVAASNMPPANAADDSCANIDVVFARGTFEAPGVGATGQAFVDALTARLPGKTVEVYAVDYPASLDFGQATDGIVDASTKIQAIAANCPTTKIVLGGYSQGAAVAGFTTADAVPAGVALPAAITGPMPAAIAPHVAAVVLFGTPDDSFLNLVDHDAPSIAIGAPYAAKTLELCATGDPVCFPGGVQRSAHSSYKDNGMADEAADFAAHQLGAPTPAATVQQTAGQIDTEIDPPQGN